MRQNIFSATPRTRGDFLKQLQTLRQKEASTTTSSRGLSKSAARSERHIMRLRLPGDADDIVLSHLLRGWASAE